MHFNRLASGGLFCRRVEFYAAASRLWSWNNLDTLHLMYEREAAQVLGIPYEKIMQTALIPVAYTRNGFQTSAAYSS